MEQSERSDDARQAREDQPRLLVPCADRRSDDLSQRELRQRTRQGDRSALCVHHALFEDMLD